MRATLTALTDELRRLKASGVKTLTVSPESVECLRRAVRRRTAAHPPGATFDAAPMPDRTGAPQPPQSRSAAVDRQPIAAPSDFPSAPELVLPPGDKSTRWAWLVEQVTKNEVCGTNVRPGKKVVVGVGSLDARIFFCGEAPGAEEEVQGEPFVGPAGQLLTKMIEAMGLQRSEVYIGNIMNWRPRLPVAAGAEQVGNRPPTPPEMAYCLPFLRAQIEIVAPEVIVALGATAAKGLLGPDSFKAVGDVRGKWQIFAGRSLMVTYHPSYILRNGSNRSKRVIWEDLLKVMQRVGLPISPKQRGFFLPR